jgi:hypothetical protein
MENIQSLRHTVWDCKYHVIWCQAKIEMSYSYQSRNVLFSGFGFYGFASLISVNTKLETPPPRVVS